MSEQGGTKPTTNPDWATAAAGGDVTEPAAGKRQSGYLFNDIFPHGEANWLLKAFGDWLTWLAGWHTRAFDSLAEAIAGADGNGHHVAVKRQVFDDIGDLYVNQQGAQGALAMQAVCTDGKRVFYMQNHRVYAIDPNNPSVPLWGPYLYTGTGSGQGVAASDGAIVAVLWGGATYELHVLDASTGATYAGWPAGQSLTGAYGMDAASNGGFLAALSANSSTVPTAGYLQVWSRDNWAAGNGSYVVHGGGLWSVCVDHENAYIAGKAGTGGYHIRALVLSASGTLAVAWSLIIPSTAGTPELYDVCTDSEYVYCVGVNVTDGSVEANVWCLNRVTGAIVWRSLTSSGTKAWLCVVDDRYLYVVDENQNVRVLDKRNGQHIETLNSPAPSSNRHFIDCDGMHVWGPYGNNVRASRRGAGTRLYAKTADNDKFRKPFHKLAVPVGDHHG